MQLDAQLQGVPKSSSDVCSKKSHHTTKSEKNSWKFVYNLVNGSTDLLSISAYQKITQEDPYGPLSGFT